MSEDLHTKYRPTELEGVLGQADTVRVIKQLLRDKKFPHASLFVGPSGCGKTTLARIVRVELGCADIDFCEVNSADFRGIDTIRDIRQRINLKPLAGGCRVWLIDECHKLSGDAQTALLKIYEEPPAHAYIMLATTEPEKLIEAIRTRPNIFRVKSLSSKHLESLVHWVAGKEKLTVTKDVVEQIVSVCNGCPRVALVNLQRVAGLNEEEAIRALADKGREVVAYDLVKALVYRADNWSAVVALINSLDKGEDWEGLRRNILANATNVLLKGGKGADRAYLIITACKEPWFHCGRAGLVAACWEVVKGI